MVHYEPPKNNRYRRVYRILQQTAFYDELVADLNASFSFPRNIRLVFDQGQEEDAVDEFAAILLIDTQEYEAVIAGMDQFDIDAIEEAELGEDLVYWDEHSFSDQRFYNTACLIYGSAPDEFSDWVYDEDNGWGEDAFLPVERAEICEADYQRALTSWERLLAPYLK